MYRLNQPEIETHEQSFSPAHENVNFKPPFPTGKFLTALLLILLFLVTLSASLLIVPPHHIAIAYNTLSGELNPPYGEGTYLLFPFIYQREVFSLGKQRLSYSNAPSSEKPAVIIVTLDQRTVLVDLEVHYHLRSDSIQRIYLNWGQTYEEAFMSPHVLFATHEMFKRMHFDSAVSGRLTEVIETWIAEQLYDVFEEEGFTLDKIVVLKIVPA